MPWARAARAKGESRQSATLAERTWRTSTGSMPSTRTATGITRWRKVSAESICRRERIGPRSVHASGRQPAGFYGQNKEDNC
jgi:hypothetical protein